MTRRDGRIGRTCISRIQRFTIRSEISKVRLRNPLFDDVRVLDVTLDDRGAASRVKEAASNVAPDPGRKARLYLDEVADMMLEEGYEDSVMDKEDESKAAVRFCLESQGLFLNRLDLEGKHEVSLGGVALRFWGPRQND